MNRRQIVKGVLAALALPLMSKIDVSSDIPMRVERHIIPFPSWKKMSAIDVRIPEGVEFYTTNGQIWFPVWRNSVLTTEIICKLWKPEESRGPAFVCRDVIFSKLAEHTAGTEHVCEYVKCRVEDAALDLYHFRGHHD